MRKIISVLLAAASAAVISAVPVSAEGWETDGDMTALLSELNIMNGDETGDFKLDSYVTRAEMTKVAVASSSYKNTVAVGLQFSPFSDVRGSFWGAPYIQAAVSAGIVEGYIDGTFRPDGTVTYEEAITMMLKVLGYTNDDFGASYPYGQVGMAQNLDMTDGIAASIGDSMTRRDIARLVCNTLETNIKDTANELLSIHDCAVVEDVTIIASRDEDPALSDDEISTSNGKYDIDEDFDRSYVGTTGDMVVKNGKKVIVFRTDDENLSERYVIYSTLNDSILCYRDGDNTELHQFEISGTTPCYMASTAYTYSQLSSSMEMGDMIRIHYKDNGEIDYINYSEGTVEGPIQVTSDAWRDSFDTNAATKVVRDGNIVSESDIQTDDIIYYSDSLNMVLAYTTKVTGVYESASPSKDAPSSVTISGKTYELEGAAAFDAMSSNGDINYGDTVTVLLGRDGRIAGVAGAAGETSSSSEVGYLISTGRQNFENADGTTYSSYYADIVTAGGTEYKYPTKSDYSDFTGRVVRATIRDGKASIGVISGNSSLTGYVSYADMKIGGKSVSKDVKILDVASEFNNDSIQYTKTFMQRIDGLTLTSSQVIYYGTDSKGSISELILRDVTGDMYDYGIVTTAYTENTMATSIDVGGTEYTSQTIRGLARDSGVKVKLNRTTGTLEGALGLGKVSGSVSELTATSAVIGSKTYLLSDKVAVYVGDTLSGYSNVSINEVLEGDHNFTFYYDKAQERGGRIRVIVATPK